jgi:hypothetical protein
MDRRDFPAPLWSASVATPTEADRLRWANVQALMDGLMNEPNNRLPRYTKNELRLMGYKVD